MRKLLLTLLICASLPVIAQQKQQLSFEEALATAMMKNQAIEASKAGELTAEFKRKATAGLRFPKLGVTAAYTVMSQDIGHVDLNPQKEQVLAVLGSLGLPIPPAIVQQLSALDLSYTLQKSDFGMVGAELIVPIYTGGKINAAITAAKINEQTAKVKTEQVSEELFVEVAQRYWGLLLQQKVEALRGEVVAGVELHLKDAEQLSENGIIARGELLFAEMAYADALSAFGNSRLETATVNSALGGSLGGMTGDFLPTTELFMSSNVESLESFKSKVRNNSTQLKQVELVRKLAQQAVRAERAGFFPQIAAMGGYDIWNHQLSDQIPRWVAGVGVKINLFDGLMRENNFRAAKSQVAQVEAVEKKANIDIMVLVEKLYNTLLASQKQVVATQKSIVFGQEYLRIKQNAFSEGMATSADVVDAQLNLTKYKTERLAAIYTFDLTLSQLLALAGEPERIFEYLSITDKP